MKDKNKKLMLIVSILVLGIGLTFAYFVVGVNILGTGGSTKLATSNLIRVKYDAGTGKLVTNGLNPGHSTSKGFKVTVTPTKTVQDVTYRIYLNITSNTFEVCSDSNYNSITNDCEKDEEELIYILKDGNGNEITRGDLTNGVTGEIELARETKKVATETVYNYTIEIEFKDTGKDQNHNQSKTIQGEIKVEFAEPDTSDLNIMAVYVEKEDKPGKYDSVDEIPINKSLDREKSYCEANGEKVEGIEFYYDWNKGTAGINKFVSKGTKCYLFFQDSSASLTAKRLNIKNIKSGEPNFEEVAIGAETEDNNGVYIVQDGMYGGDSYYWRGAATTNHVIYSGKCWRIIRINGDGSIRLVYNGPTKSGNVCPGNGANTSGVAISMSSYGAAYNFSSSVGWTYTKGSQRPTDSANSTATLLKTSLEEWYSTNIGDKTKIVPGKFCNDRNTQFNETWRETGDNQYYAAYERVFRTKKPTLNCSGEDIYTLNVGMITADEIIFAGESENTTNERFYLHINYPFWTMSPHSWESSFAKMFVWNQYGFISGQEINNGASPKIGVRPVINLDANTLFNVNSDGTENNPYIAQYNIQ